MAAHLCHKALQEIDQTSLFFMIPEQHDVVNDLAQDRLRQRLSFAVERAVEHRLEGVTQTAAREGLLVFHCSNL